MLNKNLENAFLYITLCVATAVPIYAIMLATIVKRASALRYRQLIIVAVIAFMPIGVILSPCIYGLACLSLYYLPEKDGAACLWD